MTDIDILADSQKDLGDNAKKTIAAAATRLQSLHLKVAELQSQIQALSVDINTMETKEIPDIMDEIGMRKFELQDGSIVEVKDVVSGSIPKDNANEALDWLRKNEAADLIKSEVKVGFNKGEEKLAVDLLMKLRDTMGLNAALTSGVHAMTLSAWAREQLSQGKEIPLELLGIWVGRRAKMKLAKGEANG